MKIKNELKMKKLLRVAIVFGIFILMSSSEKLVSGLTPAVVTQLVQYDTDDPAIWIDRKNFSKSLVIGTDKATNGRLYAFGLDGKIIRTSIPLQRPNNVDVAYGVLLNGRKIDVAVTTERETNKLRIFSLPDLLPIDNGGIPVFVGQSLRLPMGISIYTRKNDKAIFAIVSRKNGPSGTYLWQYQLTDNGNGAITGTLVRKFGNYSGIQEIESVAVDNDLGFVYYSDERFGVRKYYADPALGNNTQLAAFGQSDFARDCEGIAIYNTSATTGYILVSNQQANSFNVYRREGTAANGNQHTLIAQIPVSAVGCDGAEVTNINLGGSFSKGLFVAMSNGKVFHYYGWQQMQQAIDAQAN